MKWIIIFNNIQYDIIPKPVKVWRHTTSTRAALPRQRYFNVFHFKAPALRWSAVAAAVIHKGKVRRVCVRDSQRVRQDVTANVQCAPREVCCHVAPVRCCWWRVGWGKKEKWCFQNSRSRHWCRPCMWGAEPMTVVPPVASRTRSSVSGQAE